MPSNEPWLQGTKTDVPAVARAVLHALQLAEEDLRTWCANLSDVEVNARPAGLAPIAFHLRHAARSVDRLLTYAEGGSLSEHQLAQLKSEFDPDAKVAALFTELDSTLREAAQRIRALAVGDLDEPRTVGRNHLPTTLAGLLVHVADHTQRHVGQAITTAKILRSQNVR
jgi:uncharacterized damage-inducible protein DinB